MLLLRNSFVLIFSLWVLKTFSHTPDQSPHHSHISSDFDWDAYLSNDMNETMEITSPLIRSTTMQDDQTNQQKNTPPSNIPEKTKSTEKKRIYSEKQIRRKKEYQKQWYLEKQRRIKSLPQKKQDAMKEAERLRRQLSRAKQKELTGYTSKAKKVYAELRELMMNGKATVEQEIQWQEQREKARKARKRKTNMTKTL